MKSKLLKNDNRHYFIVHDEVVEDLQTNLSALGLWVHLWSKPDNWIICYKGIMKQTGIGSNSTIKKLLGSLESAGYIWKETNYVEGRPVHNWVITNDKRDSPNYRKCNRGPKSLKVDTITDSVITQNVITENVITESVDKISTKRSSKALKEDSLSRTLRDWASAEKVFIRLNELTGSRFRFKNNKGRHTEDAKSCLARIEESSFEDAIKIVETMVARWTGTDKQEFLRPSTLFRPRNYENYLGMISANLASKKQNKPNSNWGVFK